MPVTNLAALPAARAQATIGCRAVLRSRAGWRWHSTDIGNSLNILCSQTVACLWLSLSVLTWYPKAGMSRRPTLCFHTALWCEGSSWGSKAPDGAEEIPGSSQVLLPLPKPLSAPGQQGMKAVTLGVQGPFPNRCFSGCHHEVIWVTNLYHRTCPDSGQTFYRKCEDLPWPTALPGVPGQEFTTHQILMFMWAVTRH